MKIKVVGAGLIGTSIALGLRQAGHHISIIDSNPAHLTIARDLVGGEGNDSMQPDMVIVATPIEVTLEVLCREFDQNPQSVFIDIGGLKSELLSQVESFPALAKVFCGSHPMAGREISGPTGARGDLFQGCTWILTPSALTEKLVIEKVTRIVKELGGFVSEVSAEEHDRAIAAVSHIPQILSTAIARNLISRTDNELNLAGQGLRDLTRLADSNPVLWAQLLIENSESDIENLEAIKNSLEKLITDLKLENLVGVIEFFTEGNEQKSRIPGKHGGKSRDYAFLPIVIDDKPGQLAAIFDACSKAKVNVEDLFIEHSPGQQTGLITLAVSPEDALKLKIHLENESWRVHDVRAQR